ncbi:S26 family signal peptidase [Sphaerisporangium fuscum]|uniref:S26 family signal peptidase n=1 Tax=Sphaerisporangium fuscum TaxID=2835868 RepID=UPI001BDD925A|nr:S26 family signal peptidase [Sphaerisporangium fuscum]
MIAIPLAVICAAVAVVLLRRRLVIVAVSGPSMEPNYLDGDRLLALRHSSRALRCGQVVVIDTAPPSENPGSPMNIIKRVVAVPGQPVPAAVRGDTEGTVVPPGHIVVLGDNRRRSVDSRQLGFIPTSKVVATVLRKMSI